MPAVDGGTRRCVQRADAPGEVSRGADPGRIRVAWNGEHWGVVWSEVIDDEPAVFFARVDADGRRPRPPLRVSERRTHASAPAVVWNRTAWSVFFTGGIREVGDLYQARVTSRGSAVGRPWRMTRGERLDLDPAVATSGTATGLVWVARDVDQRWSVWGEVLDRWDRPGAPPALMRNSSLALGPVELHWTGQDVGGGLRDGRARGLRRGARAARPGGLPARQRAAHDRRPPRRREQRAALRHRLERPALRPRVDRAARRPAAALLPLGERALANALTEPRRVGDPRDVAAAPALAATADGALVLAW